MSNADQNNSQKKKPMSARYPYYSLKETKDFLQKVGKIAGKGHAEIKSIMRIFNTDSIHNNAMSYSISSSEYFGLAEKTKAGVKLTNLGREIIYPTIDDDKIYLENLKKSLVNPKLYRQLFDRYEDEILPSNEILENVFNSMGIIRSKVKRAVKTFLESVEFVGVLDQNHLLSIKNLPKSGENENFEQKSDFDNGDVTPLGISTNKPTSTEKKQSKSRVSSVEYFNFPIPLGSGKVANIQIPHGTTIEQIVQIEKMIETIKSIIQATTKEE